MMKNKMSNKYLKYLAVGLFVFALVANIRITLTDPFMFTSEIVLAQESSTDDCESAEGLYNYDEYDVGGGYYTCVEDKYDCCTEETSS
jgi:hypothetical protein